MGLTVFVLGELYPQCDILRITPEPLKIEVRDLLATSHRNGWSSKCIEILLDIRFPNMATVMGYSDENEVTSDIVRLIIRSSSQKVHRTFRKLNYSV